MKLKQNYEMKSKQSCVGYIITQCNKFNWKIKSNRLAFKICENISVIDI